MQVSCFWSRARVVPRIDAFLDVFNVEPYLLFDETDSYHCESNGTARKYDDQHNGRNSQKTLDEGSKGLFEGQDSLWDVEKVGDNGEGE
jgi:hypothetical protein